jgi:hypothetical protein
MAATTTGRIIEGVNRDPQPTELERWLTLDRIREKARQEEVAEQRFWDSLRRRPRFQRRAALERRPAAR